MSDVLQMRSGSVLVCTLNRPDSANSLTGSMTEELLEAFEEAARDDAIRVIVTKGAGEHFCVGADFGDLESYEELTLDDVARRGFTRLYDPAVPNEAAERIAKIGFNEVTYRIAQLRKPMIAAVHGAAAGGGLSVALMHHFRFAATTARFRTALGALGLAMELGMSITLPSLVGRQKALDMFLTNRKVEANEALAIGLVDCVVAPERLDEEVMEYADLLARQAPLAVKAAIEQLMLPVNTFLRDRLELEWRALDALFSTRDRREGVKALLERRDPAFVGR